MPAAASLIWAERVFDVGGQQAAGRPSPAALPAVPQLLAAPPEEFTGPVGYSDRWLWIALGLVLAIALYYVVVVVLTRPRRERPVVLTPTQAHDLRAEHLGRIDEIARAVAVGEISAKVGHLQLSETLRSWVAATTALPAQTMTLSDFRTHAPTELVDAIELIYPPEFAPDTTLAEERFSDAADRARGLVTTWT